MFHRCWQQKIVKKKIPNVLSRAVLQVKMRSNRMKTKWFKIHPYLHSQTLNSYSYGLLTWFFQYKNLFFHPSEIIQFLKTLFIDAAPANECHSEWLLQIPNVKCIQRDVKMRTRWKCNGRFYVRISTKWTDAIFGEWLKAFKEQFLLSAYTKCTFCR